MNNKDIREKAKQMNIKLWQIADRLGMCDSYFSKKLRKELTQSEKRKIFSIIDELVEGR